MIVPIPGLKQGEGSRGYADRFSEPEALSLVGEHDWLTPGSEWPRPNPSLPTVEALPPFQPLFTI
jgi:hypothetical protein